MWFCDANLHCNVEFGRREKKSKEKKKLYLAVKLSWCHQIWDQNLLLAGMEKTGELYMLGWPIVRTYVELGRDICYVNWLIF